MSDPVPVISLYLALTASIAPLAAFATIVLFLRKDPKKSAGVSIFAVSVSLVSALTLLVTLRGIEKPMSAMGNWMISGGMTVHVGVLLDPLSLLMLVIVATICFLVQVYSLGYMAKDPGFSRYYAYMSLFAWAMISLVISPTVLQLYVFWELVGLSSYLLIGFWYEKFSASHAGKKAFVMTRLGDVAFMVGILILLVMGGTLNILELNHFQFPGEITPGLMTLSALLIFGGVIGKSAQFPLMTWLPDAMEGPTPVSALLHSATMVAAGVYLLGRLFPFFSHSTTFMTVVLAIGTVSMLMAATMAFVSRDIKQVWAYSTISQLGYMVMGLGAGGYFAGVFHLTTHAAFKALLFLCAGALIHAFGTNDMFEIGNKGGRRLKIPVICMIIAGAALCGIWPFSGFFSKEAILAQLARQHNPIWLAAGLLGAFFTTYYTFRLLFIILFPKNENADVSHEHGEDSHGSEAAINAPLIVLAGVTVVSGFFQGGLESFLSAGAGHETAGHGPMWLAPLTLGLAIVAIGIAWLEFGRKKAEQVGFVEKIPALRQFFLERWYLDRFYAWFVKNIIDNGISALCKKNDDEVIDGVVHAVCSTVVGGGRVVSNWHKALIQTKLMVLFAAIFGLTLLILILG